jgi:CRP/FNR family transcriptional regulator
MERPPVALDPLAGSPYFDGLSDDDRRRIVALARRRRYEAGAVLFLEGEECAGLFIVLEGVVKVYKTSEDGREQILRLMAPGDSFNEVPVFDGGPNPASAAAVEPTEALVLSRELVLRLLDEYPAFARAVVRTLASRLRHLVALVEDLSFRQVTARVARILLQSVAPREGVGAGAGRRARITQREIAQMAGTAREVVARALRVLEDAGAVEVERGNVRIVDVRRLEALS